MKRKPLFRRGPIYRYWKEQLAGPERVPPWRLMNFALPSGVLGAVWRVSPFVVGYRRRSNGLCASRWCMHTQKGVAAYCVAVQREHEKARRYFATEGAA